MFVKILAAVCTVVLTGAASAQDYESDGRAFVENVSTCNGTPGGSRAATLPSDIPRPVLITDLTFGNQGAPWPAGAGGIWAMALDRGGQYVASSGYPATQNGSFYHLIGMAVLEVRQGAPLFTPAVHFDPPLVYRDGDLILIDVPCVGGFSVQPSWALRFRAAYGSTAPLPPPPSPPPGQTVYVGELDTNVGGNAGIAIRGVITAGGTSGQAFTQIRIRISGKASGSKAQHASAGLSDGGSGIVGLPVELKFNGQSGYVVPPNTDIWSDWAPLSFNAGASIVFSTDKFGATTADNVWAYRSNATGNTFYSFSPSALSATMQGTVTAQPGRIHDFAEIQAK